MIPPDVQLKKEEMLKHVGFYTSALMALVTLVTFGIAIFTPPLSGPFCVENCLEYPYTDIISRFPRDYIWMYPATLLMLVYVLWMVCMHSYASGGKQLFSLAGLAFGLLSAATLLIDYFIQLSVIQPSLVNGETDGIAILTQYNAHGIFIVLEELGYLLMSISLLCMAPVFSGQTKLDKAIRWFFAGAFVLTIIAFTGISAVYGISREYRFEVWAITINWLALIAGGILVAKVFKNV